MSVSITDITDSVVLTGSQFSEPMRVLGNPSAGDGFVLVNLVGTRTNTFKGGVTLTKADLASITIERPAARYGAQPRLFKLGLEALRISLAQEYDPFFGLSISRVDPLGQGPALDEHGKIEGPLGQAFEGRLANLAEVFFADFDFQPGIDVVGAEFPGIKVAQQALDLVRRQDFADNVEDGVIVQRITNLLKFFQELLEDTAFDGVLGEEIEDEAIFGLAVTMNAAHPLLQAIWVPRDVVIKQDVATLEVDPLAGSFRSDKHLGWQHGHRAVASPRLYGMTKWEDFFSARQKGTMAWLAAHVQSFSSGSETSLQDLMGVALDRLAMSNMTFTRWNAHGEKIQHGFGRQAFPMVWDFAEVQPFSDCPGNVESCFSLAAEVVDANCSANPGQVKQADATESPLSAATSTVWFTDPPYWDNVAYADLSDFFFVWLKRSLPKHPFLRDPFDLANPLTPKAQELTVTTAVNEKSKPKDGDFFFQGMSLAFKEGARVLRHDGVGCVVFAHKTTEGWESLLSGMLNSGFVITASWPITTEMATRMIARDTAALAGSVHLVCRPRNPDAGTGEWSQVKLAMERRIREWLPTLLKHGVRGADAIFSCLGPALESYSRYDKVLTAADREVPLGGNPDAVEPHERGFLAYVFETLSKEALKQVLGDAETEGFEEDSRMTALFLWTLQATKTNGGKAAKSKQDSEEDGEADEDEEKPKKAKAGIVMPFDTFIRITRPMGIHYQDLERRVIEIEKGVVRLLPVRERTEQLLGEAGSRPGADISLEEVNQLELGLVMKRREAAELPKKGKRGQKAPTTSAQARVEAEFTTLDRLHRAMLLFALGRSTLLRQVLESEMKKSKRFERLALALNALYPDGSDERRMLEGVQAAMRGVR